MPWGKITEQRNGENMSWYAIFVETGYEDAFCHYIEKVRNCLFREINYTFLVPKRKIYERKNGVQREVVRTMFPGYVLINTDHIVNFYMQAKSSPYVIRFLTLDKYFLEVKEEEISKILLLVDSKGLIELSKAFMANDKVVITEGPLFGMEGMIKKIDKRKGRAKVDFSINENRLLIELGIEIIRKV